MKNKLLTTLFILSSIFTNAQTFSVGEPIQVAPGFGNYHPQMEILSDNNPAIIWTNASNNNLYFTRMENDVFTNPIQLNPDGLQVQDYNWSGADLSIWNDDVYVVFRELGFDTGHIFLVKSEDNGLTFGDTVRVDNLVDAYGQFPDIAVYDDTVYVTYMTHGFTTMNPQMVISRSVDGGQTFENEIDITSWIGFEVCDCCQPEISVDAEKIVVIYRENESNIRDIKGVVSYDRGQTFTQYIVPDDNNWTLAACPSTGPDMRILPNGNPAIVYRTTISSQAKIFAMEYDLVSNEIIDTVEIFMTSAANTAINYPQIATYNNYVAVVWEGLGSGTDVFFNAGDNGLGSLNPNNAINVTNITASQSKPDVAISSNGFHVVYAEISGANVMYCQINMLNNLYEDELDITVYPNPTSSILTIDINQNVNSYGEIILTNSVGQIVLQKEVEPNLILDVTSLSQGIYFGTILLNDNMYNFTFVKE